MNKEWLELAGEVLIGTLIVAGALISALSAWGLIRLPDVYTRSHAAAKSATLGVLLVLAGAFFYFMLVLEHVSAKLLLGIVFVFLTSPVAGHLTGRAAYRSGVPLWKRSVQDDLNPSAKREKSGGS
ncbi:multicomponent Na+:H+ antiporter subunit G [Paenibacillus sp. UNCCL117]|uniref:monovalent cation/H(+) antiporter subunit G n=1 Tax=unclassified Paenibacillus TaxID=185978 RepID=UPI000884BBD2|nr:MULTISPECIES: monovalent cation/H(+) antiporter subunit G [unclassified Paenibacillus]SDC18359.1 multisubunit sodium/proton antiporter, MrpG subunit [Paenibacillus sp. cl123]SFW18187.1 multicomponent Na+:H+ antiporter subunit G [Paenibacillus sp. UNCCL117]